ncbi:hypothetical protein ACI65C_005596 [Semiaphis heraclei]
MENNVYVRIASRGGTFKTVSKTIYGDYYQLFKFYVIYNNVSLPMVYIFLTSKTEIIYKELFLYDCHVLTLQYDKLTIMTVHVISQIKSIALIFPNIEYKITMHKCIICGKTSSHLHFYLLPKNENRKKK